MHRTVAAVFSLAAALAGRPSAGAVPAAEPASAHAGFEDITEAAGLKGLSAGRTCAWGDFNGDGFVDVMTAQGLFRNEGGKRFERVEGVPRTGDGVWADFDNDGRLDFLSIAGKGALLKNLGDGSFEEKPFVGNPTPSMPRAACADVNGDGLLDLYITNYEVKFGGPINPDYLYLATAPGAFGPPAILTGKACWAARGANWADFDNDGDQDLYVSNYRLMPNALWVNGGEGQLEDQAKVRGVYGDATAGKEPASKYYPAYEYTGHTIGSCWGDLNNDGNLDLVVVNFSHPPKFQNRIQIAMSSGPPEYRFTNRNRGNAAGIYWQESYAKGALSDYDNDGDLDLYATTVYPRDKGDLFRNDGTGMFTPVGEANKVRVGGSYQIAWADVDNDGDLDLMNGGRLFRNKGGPNRWLKVKVEGGAGSNRSAVGARVRVTAGSLVQVREISCGNSGNQDPLVAHFGLGVFSGATTVEVRFPSGKTATQEAQACTTCTIREEDAKAGGEKRAL